MKRHRTLSMLLAVCMAASLFAAVPPAFAENNETWVYKASEAWYEPADDSSVTENTYNGHTEWKWQRKDSGQDWFDFAQYHTAKGSFGMTPGQTNTGDARTAGKAWSTADGAWNHPAVGEGWMIPFMQSGNPGYAVSRAFTAPKSGKVILSTEDGNIYAGSSTPGNASNRTAFIRITLNGEQVWPETPETDTDELKAGYGMRMPETSAQTYAFEPILLTLAEGDVLRFEVSNGDSTAQYGKLVFWQPVVTYFYEPEAILPEVRDSVPLDQNFAITFADEMDAVSEENIAISPADSGERVGSLTQSGKELAFDFESLQSGTEYAVTISGLQIGGVPVGMPVLFSFTTEKEYEYPVYESDDAWPETLTADTMKNDDPVWRFLYKNNATKDTLTPYAAYTLTAENNTQPFAQPAYTDGAYDYATTPLESSSAAGRTRIYCDSTNSAQRRNAMGRWWMRVSTATGSEPLQSVDNEIVKAFTAPESGTVVITAKDLAGASKIYNKTFSEANLRGAVLKIVKKTATGDEELWEYTFVHTAADVPANGLDEYSFAPLTTDIRTGEQLWFILSGESGGSAYAKMVFWNPVVTYQSVVPDIIEMMPEDGAEGAAPNFVQRIRYRSRIAPVDLSNIEIDGGAASENVWLEEDDTVLCIQFAGLKPYTAYNVKLYNVNIYNVPEAGQNVSAFSFTTGAEVQPGEVYLLDGRLHAGQNTVCADINNAAGSAAPFSAALLAVVCKTGADGYEVIEARRIVRNDIGENDTVSIDVNLPDTDGYYIKAVLLESMSSVRALTEIKTFGS